MSTPSAQGRCGAIAFVFAIALPAAALARPAETDFPVVLGTFSTTLVGSLPARTENVRLAAAALDGAILRPGEALSFNKRVGPRTRERGYQDAPVILRETRQLQTGGGVCQVASTVFVAAMVAGLSPLERWKHSSLVDYIPLGEDATISWGVKDLRFANDLDQAIRLRVEVVGSTLSARIEGESTPDASFELETVARDVPAEAGESDVPGHEVELYRVTHGGARDGERELVHRDVYPPSIARAAAEGTP